MTIHKQILHLLEEFKIPATDPYCPEDWKDWYHYILYDPVSKIRILYNLCFNGRPGTGYITDTCFITVPKGFAGHRVADMAEWETYGFARNTDWSLDHLVIQPLHFQTENILLSIRNDETSISAADRRSGIAFNVCGHPVATPVYVPELAPYGNGFIGWGVVPGFRMNGWIQLGAQCITVDERWYCYHDRNFGRFNWGAIGWTWFVLNASEKDGRNWCYVLHRSNDNQFRKFGAPILFVFCEQALKKVFLGNGIDVRFFWEAQDQRPPVLPGAMASIFGDRSITRPSKLIVRAADETDFATLTMPVQTHTELIVPDSERKQYTFIKELSGRANTTQLFDGQKSTCKDGFFYAEHVH
ncbi:MAG: hypothetical protein H6575_01275 [Lewinellaceae bacterium]|nr:hypothetical protein [Lewinellaceae bacterium]